MSEPGTAVLNKLKVFISYSRKDLVFAERIVRALEARGLAPKIDTRDLPKLEDWRRELLGFIREADAVVFDQPQLDLVTRLRVGSGAGRKTKQATCANCAPDRF